MLIIIFFQIKDAINWHYFQPFPRTSSHLLNSLIKLSTEINHELPLYKTIELLTTPLDQPDQQNIVQSDINFSPSTNVIKSNFRRQMNVNNNNLYVYVFHHSNAMDMRGTINYFGGLLITRRVMRFSNDDEIFFL